MIKYLFLKIGNEEYFQPLNKPNRGIVIEKDELEIMSQRYPELLGNNLFLNGDMLENNYRILKSNTPRLSKFIPLIKEYNKGQTNV